MMYKPDWEKTEKKFIEFWNRENSDRPLISVIAPREGYVKKEIKKPEKLIDRWTNIEYLIGNTRENFASTYFGGEAYPNFCPDLGPDIFAAFLGCELEFGETTSWAKHFVKDWTTDVSFRLDIMNLWWKKVVEITEAAFKDSNGDYIVGITDIHSGADGLVSLRGPENLCLDLFDCPEEVKTANFQLLEVYKKVMTAFFDLSLRHQKGTSNWMGIWHPGKWYVTSSDFIGMVSKEVFSEFILPELHEELNFLDASIFHLDGPGALTHLDALLEIPKLKGIQWVYGDGQPTASHWLPVLKKIQRAGKNIQVVILPEELDLLLEELDPEGVMYCVYCDSEQDARDLIKKADNSYKKRLY